MKGNILKQSICIVFLLFLEASCNLDIAKFAEDIGNGTGTAANSTNTGGVTYTIGGTITGLQGSGLVLQDLGADNLSIATDGAFTFTSALSDATPYDVTVLTQPTAPSQTCTITSGTGILSGANVSDIAVNCVTNSYIISGTITGLQGSGLVLQNNGIDNISVSADGIYNFATPLQDQSSFTVTILSQPILPNQYCTVSSGSGTIAGAAPNGFVVNCSTNTYTIGGTVTGLAGTGLVLQNNGSDNLSISANGSFSFTTPISDGAGFNVSVLSQPTNPWQTCSILGGNGNLTGSNLISIAINCVMNTHNINVTVTGLAAATLVLQNNYADNLTITSSGSYTFATMLNSGAGYAVMVLSINPASAVNCSITGGFGNVTNSEVQVTVSCQNVWIKIAAGSNHTLAIRVDGTLWAWGDNSYGQLGDGTTIAKTSPVQIGTSTTWTTITAGGNHNLGIDGGKLFAWGNNGSGQLGDGTTIAKTSPVQIGTSTTWTSIEAGGNHSLGIDGGKLFAWGYNGYGQLGDGTTTYKSSPVQIGTSTTWTSTTAGDNHSLGIDAGKLFAWGYNVFGQLGDGTTASKTLPVQIGTSTTWTSTTAVGSYSLGINGGKLFTWGYNGSGQLGDGTNIDKSSPVQIGASTTWTTISAGNFHSFGIDGGKLFAWGNNGSGELGDATTTSNSSPVRIGISTTWTSITAGSSHSLGIDGGKLFAWGNNFFGQLGLGDTVNRLVPTQGP